MNKLKILHIVPHLGGGVGKVLLGWFKKVGNDPEQEHSIICLDDINKDANKLLIKYKIRNYTINGIGTINWYIREADIVIIHFWNHPLLYDFLVRNPLPASRVIIWSHISGFHAPSIITEKILNYSDLFVFTTPISYGVEAVKKAKKEIYTVWATGGVEQVQNIRLKKHDGFIVGYIGTVDYCKMNIGFLHSCFVLKKHIPNIKFIVCGGGEEKIKEKAKELGLENTIQFTGYVKDIKKYLSIFDIFGYPLNPEHYGTCDQSLAEAMTAGICPVVLNNPMEKTIVENKETGIVVCSMQEYKNSIIDLYKHEWYLKQLAHSAKQYAINTFSVERMISQWNIVFNNVMEIPKTEKQWVFSKYKRNITHADVFLESLGEKEAKQFLNVVESEGKHFKNNNNWNTKSKGSIHHYHKFFPNDIQLKNWSIATRSRI